MNFIYSIRKLSHRLGIFPVALAVYQGFIARKQWHQQIQFNQNLIKPGDLCFDVGANRGQSAQKYLSLGARVVAYEPLNHAINELRIRCRRWQENLVLEKKVLGKSAGTVDFYESEYDQMSSLDATWAGSNAVRILIPMSTLDLEISKHGLPKFCKIDVEGAEYQVISGLSQPIPILSIEYHATQDDIHKKDLCLKKLESLGKYRFNFVVAGMNSFFLPQAVGRDSLIESLLARSRSNPHEYGDVFAFLN